MDNEALIVEFEKIMHDRFGECAGVSVRALIHAGIIPIARAKFVVVLNRYHELRQQGMKSQVAVWDIADNYNVTDTRVWQIIRYKHKKQ